ncbi:cupredoxin domain-containing protein [Candidatus Woesearchaeota archaeon]|nr:cupredoxin domain-containing protein [Candidatus Woesearchaeota archaeon]
MKSYFIVIFLLAVLTTGCSSPDGNTEGVSYEAQVSGNSISKQEMEDINEPVSVKEFDIIARQWEFEPSVITVNEGDRVILHVESVDVAHGIAISEFGVNEYLNPGETVDVKFIADKKGEFEFYCNVFCGEDHSSMAGRLIVK